MKLFQVKGSELTPVRSVPLKTEKELQDLVEKNLETVFGLEFVRSEFTVKNFRIDTLSFDKENQSFVIIEYKKDRNFSVIDQGYSYLSLLLNNKSDFVLEFNERRDRNLKRDDVDWSQSRIIFVSPQFTEYQKHSVNFKDVPFELWEVRRYEDGHISFDQHVTTSDVTITTVSEDKGSLVNKVSHEIKVYTEDYHLHEKSKNRPQWIIDLYHELKGRILSLGEVEIVPRKQYIGFQRGRPFVDLVIYQEGIYGIINMKKGTLNDPNNMTTDVSEKGHWGNGDYTVIIKQDTDLDYLMFLLSQSYKDKEGTQ